MTREGDVALGAGLVDLRLELLAPVPLADDHQLQVGMAGAQLARRASTRISNRFTGTSRPTATTSGVGDFSPPGENRGSTPGGTTCTIDGLKPRSSTSSCFDEFDSVTIGVRR